MQQISSLVVAIAVALACSEQAFAQHAAFRVKGRVRNEQGEPIANAEVRLEALFGYGAGAFGGGQRTFNATTNNKGEWNVGGLQPGVWIFEVLTSEYLPESMILPIRILTTVSMGTAGMALPWDVILKPVRPPDGDQQLILTRAAASARDGKADEARSALQVVPSTADAESLAGAGRIAMLARDVGLARALFQRALERDPSSYRAALGIASTFLYQRDFDSASRAFDATRNRTHDKDEQKQLTLAIGELALIRTR